jgi:hypothetical protein
MTVALRHASSRLSSVRQCKPRHNFVYDRAELCRLCRIDVTPRIDIRGVFAHPPTKVYSRVRRLPQILGPGSFLSNRGRASSALPTRGGVPWEGLCPLKSSPLRAWRSTRQSLYHCQRRFMGFITVCSLQEYCQHVGLGMHGSYREIYTSRARMTCGLSAHGVGVEYLGTCTFRDEWIAVSHA